MNIQIFGSSKSFDTKKAERWFKERRIRVQSVDVRKYGMSLGELTSVRQAVGLEAMVDPKHPDTVLLQYLASDQAKLDKLFHSNRPKREAGHCGLLPRNLGVLVLIPFCGGGPHGPECQSEAEAAIPVSDPHPADR